MKNLFLTIKKNLLIVLIFPIIVPLFFYVRNYSETPIGVFFRASIISILFFLILLAFCTVVFRKANNILLFACIAFLLLYLYGSAYDALVNINHVLGHHKILALVYLVVLTGLALLIRKLKVPSSLILLVSFISVVFIVFQLVQLFPKIALAESEKSSGDNPAEAIGGQIAAQKADTISSEDLPDVYYVILDSYARNDMIEQDFSFDNSSFINSLEELGFYVADCSRANYMVTRSSLASSLNADYIQTILNNANVKEYRNDLQAELIKNSVVFQQFKALGYKTIAFETGYDFTQIKNADLYLEPVKPIAFFGSIDPYEVLLLKSSIFKILYDTHIPVVNKIFDQVTFPYTNHVKLQRFMFENLIKISSDQEPTFTFVHMTVPHTPFVFRADGSYTKDRRYFSGAFVTPVSNELFADGYLNQLQYVNTQILDSVQKILENSKTPPIIILQGDHGAIMEHRLPILNAYFVPNSIKTGLYSSISPVNSFRLIFQNVFGLNYPLLEDKSYFSKYETLFEWMLEPEEMNRCIK